LGRSSLYTTKETSVATGKNYSNIAFIAKDFDGNPQGAIKRSFRADGFKGNHAYSNMRDYCFRYDGDGENSRLFVFEAPIDMLSFITILEQKDAIEKNSNQTSQTGMETVQDANSWKISWKKDNYLALGGLNSSPLINYVKQSQEQAPTSLWPYNKR